MIHQYISRENSTVITEKLFADKIVRYLYSKTRENSNRLFNFFVGKGFSKFLGYVNFDLPLTSSLIGNKRFLKSCGVSLDECLEDPSNFKTARDIFERKIDYNKYRPMDSSEDSIVSPADAKVVIGSFEETSVLHIKEKFFNYDEIIGKNSRWIDNFKNGDFAIFRLTPDKYHYNHTPVSGTVVDIYPVDGVYHSCNPNAIIEMVTPYSKNKRIVTIIDTDVPGGTGVGLVAMIEIVALMIGEIKQCYSENNYDNPEQVKVGMFLKKGYPKSLYKPGSSTDILIFQKGKINFSEDLVTNRNNITVLSKFSEGFGKTIVETDLNVRSTIAYKSNRETKNV